AAAGGADAVAGLVGDDLEEPWSRLGLAAERAQGPKRPDGGVLGGLLCLGHGPGDHVSGPEGNLLVAMHDLLIGSRVAALGAREKLGIILWAALHRNALNTPRAERRFPPAIQRSGRGCV